ncbi:MAG: peptide chain release factor 3 [SAR202 cluster bacterium]|nr:peptide chain release factor 3 [SAR202 cluster bacterium]
MTEASRSNADALTREVSRRRTFAIISHPDAGKTTLTEKLLLYAGAVELAGAVRARGSQRHATSDWMSMEQERGISITATALEMEYRGYRINLLDTPGHQDFSEDTYRTLMAVDSAVMVLDAAKGIEPQTEKLFHVCRMHGIPILTFINKMDRDARDPLDLLDEIERVLGMATVPMNWPIGDGQMFQGVYDLRAQQVLRFERTAHNQRRAPVVAASLDDPALVELLGEQPAHDLRESVELLAGAGGSFDREAYLVGNLTPVFFGSALNNFGVEPFLDALVELAPPPAPRASDQGSVEPADKSFTGFVFKVQANMDPRHRDRMAFLRVCSGRFERDMTASNVRLGRSIRLSQAFRMFGRDREPIDEAYPGDVVGIISPGLLAVGDTLTAGKPLRFPSMPRFAPEHFGLLMNADINKYKQFHKGLEQLDEEGAAQVFQAISGLRREPVLAAVGVLQFDVVVARLRDEYGVEAKIERLPHVLARWVKGPDDAVRRLLGSAHGALHCADWQGHPVFLFKSEWELGYVRKQHPDVVFSDVG